MSCGRGCSSRWPPRSRWRLLFARAEPSPAARDQRKPSLTRLRSRRAGNGGGCHLHGAAKRARGLHPSCQLSRSTARAPGSGRALRRAFRCGPSRHSLQVLARLSPRRRARSRVTWGSASFTTTTGIALIFALVLALPIGAVRALRLHTAGVQPTPSSEPPSQLMLAIRSCSRRRSRLGTSSCFCQRPCGSSRTSTAGNSTCSFRPVSTTTSAAVTLLRWDSSSGCPSESWRATRLGSSPCASCAATAATRWLLVAWSPPSCPAMHHAPTRDGSALPPIRAEPLVDAIAERQARASGRGIAAAINVHPRPGFTREAAVEHREPVAEPQKSAP